MKKTLLIWLAAALMLLTFTACAADTPADTPADTAADAAADAAQSETAAAQTQPVTPTQPEPEPEPEPQPPVTELDLSAADSGGLEQLADCPMLETLNINGRGFEDISAVTACTRLKWLDARGNALTPEGFDAIRAALPECEILWDVPFLGGVYDSGIESIDLSEVEDITPEQLANVKYFTALTQLDLRSWNYSLEEMNAIADGAPHVRFLFRFTLIGLKVDSTFTEIDLRGYVVRDLEQFRAYLRFLPDLTYLDMCNCGLSNEEMASLRDEFPNVKFVWMLRMGQYRLRTDTVAFSTLVYDNNHTFLNTELIQVFQYCTDLKALDLGHHHLTDLTPLACLTDLRVLILADNHISDLTPLSNLTNVVYLELFMNRDISNLEPLAALTNLVDLNLSFTQVMEDYSPLYELKYLERLWLNWDELPEDVLEEIRANVPEGCEVCSIPWAGSCDSGWRTHERHFAQRDMFRNNYIDDMFMELPVTE